MGGDAARRARLPRPRSVGATRDETTSADDTRAAAAEMERRDVDLILYAGGDGTTRDIVDAVGDPRSDSRDPDRREDALGRLRHEPGGRRRPRRLIPDGARPGASRGRGDGRRRGRRSAPGASRRSSTVSPRTARPRCASSGPKAASRPGDAGLDALCRTIARRGCDGPHALRPGHDDAADPRRPRLRGDALGVDAVEDGALVGRDLNESQLLELLDGRSARVVVSRRRRPGLRARPRQPAAEPGGDPPGRAREPRDRRLAREAARRSIRRACSSTPATSSSTASCPGSARPGRAGPQRRRAGRSLVRQIGTASRRPRQPHQRQGGHVRTTAHPYMANSDAGVEAASCSRRRRREHRGALRADPGFAPPARRARRCRRRSHPRSSSRATCARRSPGTRAARRTSASSAPAAGSTTSRRSATRSSGGASS